LIILCVRIDSTGRVTRWLVFIMNFDSEDEFYLSVIAICLVLKKRKSNKMWCEEWLQKRSQLTHINLMKELILEPTDWRNYLRMDETTYFKLIELVSPLIQK
jgi:hypothetical protein